MDPQVLLVPRGTLRGTLEKLGYFDRSLEEPMPRVRLTHRNITSLAAGEWMTDYWDELLPGFGLRVARNNGRRVFVVRYSDLKGSKRRVTLGAYPELGLADARERARSILASVSRGEETRSQPDGEQEQVLSVTPVAPAERMDPAAPPPEIVTFGALAEVYIERHAKLKKRSWKDDERNLRVDLLPAWQDLPAHEIGRRDVAELLDGIVERGAPILANRVKALISKIFNVGIGRGLVESNPAFAVAMPSRENQRDRVLNEVEIRALWRAFECEHSIMGGTFKMRLLTAQRGDEVLRMRWDQIREGWWTIPAEVAKNGLSHRVPLSPQVLVLLEQLRPLTGDSAWVFASRKKDGESVTSIGKAAERISKRAGIEFVPHDLRRTAASFMTSMGISRLVVSKVLNHVESGITAVYDRHSYDTEKRQALDTWGFRIAAILHSSVL